MAKGRLNLCFAFLCARAPVHMSAARKCVRRASVGPLVSHAPAHAFAVPLYHPLLLSLSLPDLTFALSARWTVTSLRPALQRPSDPFV